ncbi:phage GP46 family protein [Jeongeupia sp. USM3]|uniref:phage GP46 family protein n=1 Tax=Jeongeupia sp. USM3 TaxID=1906741 RepID=UPI00089E012D|nr:phage GP46 family protein [Jeongeupia sp. USM3]AOY00094.1 hypothetical protein BJP62_06300 [Jeongeupia sp. USM3]
MSTLPILVDGLAVDPNGPAADPLVRAVVISLFTWRLAEPSDLPAAVDRRGFWGDIAPPVPNDRIGSRLWLLGREKLTSDIPLRAEDYAREALAWLVDDGVARGVDVSARRLGLDGLQLNVVVHRPSGSLQIRIDQLWEVLTHAVWAS